MIRYIVILTTIVMTIEGQLMYGHSLSVLPTFKVCFKNEDNCVLPMFYSLSLCLMSQMLRILTWTKCRDTSSGTKREKRGSNVCQITFLHLIQFLICLKSTFCSMYTFRGGSQKKSTLYTLLIVLTILDAF